VSESSLICTGSSSSAGASGIFKVSKAFVYLGLFSFSDDFVLPFVTLESYERFLPSLADKRSFLRRLLETNDFDLSVIVSFPMSGSPAL
jgi:hypothetical protein